MANETTSLLDLANAQTANVPAIQLQPDSQLIPSYFELFSGTFHTTANNVLHKEHIIIFLVGFCSIGGAKPCVIQLVEFQGAWLSGSMRVLSFQEGQTMGTSNRGSRKWILIWILLGAGGMAALIAMGGIGAYLTGFIQIPEVDALLATTVVELGIEGPAIESVPEPAIESVPEPAIESGEALRAEQAVRDVVIPNIRSLSRSVNEHIDHTIQGWVPYLPNHASWRVEYQLTDWQTQEVRDGEYLVSASVVVSGTCLLDNSPCSEQRQVVEDFVPVYIKGCGKPAVFRVLMGSPVTIIPENACAEAIYYLPD
jgi:hypothetical protein